ncbi:MAG: hypothetical protein Q8P81_03600 [Nanoarchaeota archaeon]|nr:hypothetical protein [Nanoarchaeota archaeon]
MNDFKIGDLVTFKSNMRLVGVVLKTWNDCFMEFTNSYYIVHWFNHKIQNYTSSYSGADLIRFSK